jgi:hypothetical protein
MDFISALKIFAWVVMLIGAASMAVFWFTERKRPVIGGIAGLLIIIFGVALTVSTAPHPDTAQTSPLEPQTHPQPAPPEPQP